MPTLSKFGVRAHQAIKLAEYHAMSIHDAYCGGEHLVLALLDQKETNPGEVLRLFELTPQRVEHEIRAHDAHTKRVSPEPVLYSPELNHVIIEAKAEMLKHGRVSVYPEHLLLALIDVDGDGARLLERLGVDLQELRRTVLGMSMVEFDGV